MSATAPLRVILHEGEGSTPLSGERRADVVRALLKRGYAVTCTGDAGEVEAPDASELVVLREGDGGETSDDNRSLGLSQNPTGEQDGTGQHVKLHLRDIKGHDADGVAGLVDAVREETAGYVPGEWKPWFPVIDFQRCTNCMQCLSFCLFDVYGVDGESQITVKNPDKCKTNCPACSRVCPEVAILFPKYGSGPINGDVVQQEDVDREKMKIDISALLGGDIYSMLRTRHERAASRFAKERDDQKALKERMRCLKKLQGELDVPDEVLMSLPSMDQIRAKAAAASESDADVSDPTKPETEPDSSGSA